VAEVCDGLGAACPPDTGVVDSDGDALCDGLDPCTNMAGAQNLISPPVAKLTLGKMFTEPTPGNDTLRATGTLLLPPTASFWQLFPLGGVGRVVLVDGLGVTRVDVLLPNEFYPGVSRRGWTQARSGKKWTYRDDNRTPLGGISRLMLRAVDSPAQPGGRVVLSITGKNGSFPLTDADLPPNVTVTLGDQSAASLGRCAESVYLAADCVFNAQRTQLTCRR
jgi:hypothetical protein